MIATEDIYREDKSDLQLLVNDLKLENESLKDQSSSVMNEKEKVPAIIYYIHLLQIQILIEKREQDFRHENIIKSLTDVNSDQRNELKVKNDHVSLS